MKAERNIYSQNDGIFDLYRSSSAIQRHKSNENTATQVGVRVRMSLI
jgi:hypothetical protein